jgi:hypothetical protein
MGFFGFKSKDSGFCAFCREPRVIYRKKSLNLFNIASSLLGTAVVSYLVWQEFDPRAVVIFVFMLAITEIFLQIRWRMTIMCRHCGFDPALYLKDTDAAVQKVQAHLEKRRNDPHFILARPLNLPKLSAERADELVKFREEAKNAKKIKRGRLLSREI